MFKHDQPTIPDLTIAVGNTNCSINRMTLHIGTRDMLNAVTESKIAVNSDAEISNGNFWPALEVRKETDPGLAICVSAEMLPGRYDIENNETLVRYIVLHHGVNVSGVESRGKLVFKRADCCFIV